MSSSDIVVGIDVGTTKIVTLIAEIVDDSQVNVIGVGIVPSRGMKRGIVVNPEIVVSAVRASVEKAERQSGYEVGSAFVAVSGAHISTQNSQGVVAVRDPGHEISSEDVQRALEAARVQPVHTDREVVHVLQRHYVVDGQDGIKNPVGMLGHRVEVQTTIVSGAMTSVSNLVRCIEQAGVSIDSLVLQGLAAGEACLTESERDLGVALIDIGGGTTDLAVYTEGEMVFGAVLPVGGFQVSNDIAVGLHTTFDAAEDIKLRYGCAVPDLVEDDRPIEEADLDQRPGRPPTPRMIAGFIEPRMEEIFDLLRDHLKRAQVHDLPAGVVLCGGAAQLPGVRRMAAGMFGTPVRIASPVGMSGLIDQLGSPAFAASVGLLRWGQQRDSAERTRSRGLSAGWLRSVGGWFRNFLP